MPRMTSAEYAAWQANWEALRAQRDTYTGKQPALIPTDDERESELHDMIISWCRRQDPQVPYLHGSMAHRTRRTPGEPDFVLLLPAGKTLLVECKTAEGKLSDEQILFARNARQVGHTVHVVRSYQEFLQIVK